MQHKYNAKQILFVKNVPRDSATRVEVLFTKYKPLETKNLYPTGQITTLMIALPSIGATEAALGDTDGMRFNNSVLSVERYNAKQSIVARRDARKKRNNLPSGRANYAYDDEDDCYGEDVYDEAGDGEGDGDKEKRTTRESLKATKLTTKKSKAVLDRPPRTRRVIESSGISWAGLVGGKQTDKPSPSPAPAPTPAKVDTPQEHSDESSSTPGSNLNGVSDDYSTSFEVAAINNGKARATAVPQRQSPPRIALMPWTASIGPRPLFSDLPFHSRLASYDYFYTAPEGRTPPRQAQTQDSGSSRVDEDSSQYTQAPDMARIQRGILGMPSDTTTFIRRRHCADCTFCRMRDRSLFREDSYADN